MSRIRNATVALAALLAETAVRRRAGDDASAIGRITHRG